MAIDDEGPALRRLSKMVTAHERLELISTASSGGEAIRQIRKCKPRLLLLDINLKDMSAFDVLSECDAAFDGKVVFITAYDEFALKAFEVGAVDYLLKPYDQSRFDSAIERIFERNESTDIRQFAQFYNGKTSLKLTVKEGRLEHYFSVNDVRYIQADGYHSVIHLNEGKKLVRLTLKEMIRQLPEGFERINRSQIVNLEKVKERVALSSGDRLKLSCGSELKISAKYYQSRP